MAWLLKFRLYHLASIAVDHYWLLRGHCIREHVAATDPRGDELRKHIGNGWLILHRLCAIARSIDRLPDNEIPTNIYFKKVSRLRQLLFPSCHKHFNWASNKDPHIRREFAIMLLRLEYVESLSIEDASDFHLLWRVLDRLFCAGYTGECFDFEEHQLWSHPALPCEKVTPPSWLVWFIMRGGPSLFWKQWWSDRRKLEATALLEETIKAWEYRTNHWADSHILEAERAAAGVVGSSLRLKSEGASHPKDLDSYFLQISLSHQETRGEINDVANSQKDFEMSLVSFHIKRRPCAVWLSNRG